MAKVGPSRSDNNLLEDVDENDTSLYGALQLGNVSIQTIVDEWIERFNENRESAIVELMQFFVSSSGCKGTITVDMYHTYDHTQIHRLMAEQFHEKSGDYPLAMHGHHWKRFRQNFGEFLQILIGQCQNNIIYDQFMIEVICPFVMALSDSQVRAFRHTCTLAAVKIVTGLIDVALNVCLKLENTVRQLDIEKGKGKHGRRGGGNDEAVQQCQKRRKEFDANLTDIRNMITTVIQGVFVHRYRDVVPEVRAICMSEMGFWMKRYSNMFLDDSHLKYVGWTLYDRSAEVRLCCLKALQPLYESESLSLRMDLFSSRFLPHIVQMALDVDHEVAVHAVRLCTTILRQNDNALANKDEELISELVYCSERGLAHAAGEFLAERLYRREGRSRKDELPRAVKTQLVRDLIVFFIQSQLHDHATYLIDSLWEACDFLRDWACMTDLVLTDEADSTQRLDDQSESCAIDMIVSAARLASTGEGPVGRTTNRKMTAREQKQLEEDKETLTEHFIVVLPQLLVKYKSDAEKLALLLELPNFFDLEIYTTSRQEKHLDVLLRQICDVVEKHTDLPVLTMCAKCMHLFSQKELAIAPRCDKERLKLFDDLVGKFNQDYAAYFEEGNQVVQGSTETFALAGSLQRLHAFYIWHDLRYPLWENLYSIVRQSTERQTGQYIDKAVTVRALLCCFNSLCHSLGNLDDKHPELAMVEQLKARLKVFLERCKMLLEGHDDESVREQTFLTVCDLLLLFSPNLSHSYPAYAPVQYRASRELQLLLMSYVDGAAFVSSENDEIGGDENERIEELHKRRNFLAAFCKLVTYGVISMRCAVPVFKNYIKFYNDFGDIIKKTMAMCREISKIVTGKALLVALSEDFMVLMRAGSALVDTSSEEFANIKELGRRFALSFGLDFPKMRNAIAEMHREGIAFGLRTSDSNDSVPTCLAFLEILSEFSGKLLKQDKRTVLEYLDRQVREMPAIKDSPHQSALQAYRNSLLSAGEADSSVAGGEGSTVSRSGPRGRPAKRKAALQVEVDETPVHHRPPIAESTANKRTRGGATTRAAAAERMSLSSIETPHP